MTENSIKTVTAVCAQPAALAQSLREGLGSTGHAGVLVFGDAATLRQPGAAEAIAAAFEGCLVVGCTTAGELDTAGYRTGSVTAIGFPGSAFTLAATRFGVEALTLEHARAAVNDVERQLAAKGRSLDPRNCFALLLTDGLSLAEESVTWLVQGALGQVTLFGGSAGDGLRFGQTQVLSQGQLHDRAAVLLVVSTERPFRVMRTQHFEATDEKLVVTQAQTETRVVTELNGVAASTAYAAAVGVSVDALSPEVFAQHPFMVRMGGQWHVRSIQRANPDGSLTIFCAIDEGLVLRLGRSIGLVQDLTRLLQTTRTELGSLDLVIACDCILRRLEVEATGLRAELQRVFSAYRVVGFSTYGEQIGALHVNQTFVGVAIG